MPTHHDEGSHHGWNFLFSVFFVAALGAALWGMHALRGGFLISVPPFDAFLMALASFRITRLIVYDKIARWFRNLFARPGGFFITVRELLECPWCVGIWSALIIMFSYFVFVWAWSVIFLLALAGAGSILQVIANMIGWRAETLKLEAREKGNL